MKFSDLTFQPQLLRLDVAEAYMGGAANLNALVEAKWIQPIVRENAKVGFDRSQLDAAVDRAKRDGWPSPAKKG